MNLLAEHDSQPSAVNKSRIFFHHVWKCGGANVCNMATRNGAHAPRANAYNPSIRCDAATVEELLATPMDKYSYVSWQKPLPWKNLSHFVAGGPLSQFATVTILRNPLDQALSHFSHARNIYASPTKPIRTADSLRAFLDLGMCAGLQEGMRDDEQVACCSQKKKIEGLCKRYFTEEFSDLHPFRIFRDNQQLRWLLQGADSWHGLERRRLDASDLEAGKKLLDQFDDVMILEEMHNRDRLRFAKYGWKDLDDKQGANVHRADRKRTAHNSSVYLKDAPRLLSRLREIQHWDLELYKYAQSIARRQATLV